MEIGKLIGMSVKNNSPNMLINFYPEKKDASLNKLRKVSKFYIFFGKRILDLTISITFLIIMIPILGIIFLTVFFSLGPPVIFIQKRVGMKGSTFYLYKFRTMTNDKNENKQLLPDEDRLTKIGRFLRRTSLDELPELWNVLKGDMSLVGPRPLLVEYLDRYTPEQTRRHEVKPGITGWAQINGRNAITWEQKFKYDVWYVDNLNFWLDIKILFFTLIKVLKGEGINQPGHVTMEEFKGSKCEENERKI